MDGISSFSLRSIQFEGNNRADKARADVLIRGREFRNGTIEDSYFTGTGRAGARSGRAIVVGSDVGSNAVLRVENNSVANSKSGGFSRFVEINANVPMRLYLYGNISPARSAVPPKVRKRRF